MTSDMSFHYYSHNCAHAHEKITDFDQRNNVVQKKQNNFRSPKQEVNINQQPNLILMTAQSNLMNLLHPLINILYPMIINHSTMNILAYNVKMLVIVPLFPYSGRNVLSYVISPKITTVHPCKNGKFTL